jgi:hypothetical protein
MPLAYCQLHHIAWWQRDGGLTNLANCAAYCSFHHHEIHRLGIVVTRRADGTLEHHHPDGRPYGGAPPGDRAPRSGIATPVEATRSPEAACLQPEPTPSGAEGALGRPGAVGSASGDDHAPTRFGRDQRVPRAPSRSSSIGGDGGSAPTAERVAARDPKQGSPPDGEQPLDLLALLLA